MKITTPSSKKEIRLKVASRLYKLLNHNASLYGVKPNDYIVHLILDDIKNNQTSQIPFVDNQSEITIEEGYTEINEKKKKRKLKGMTSQQIIRKIA